MSPIGEPREVGFRLLKLLNRLARATQDCQPSHAARLQHQSDKLMAELAAFEIRSYADVLKHITLSYGTIKCTKHRACRKARQELDNLWLPVSHMFHTMHERSTHGA